MTSAFISGVDIMIKILFITPKKSYEETKVREDLPIAVQYVSDLVGKFLPFLDFKCFHKNNEKEEILGPKRMKIVEFVDALVTVQYQYLDALLTTHKSFIRILKLFFKFENNNMLQRIVANIFIKIFNGPSDKLKQLIFLFIFIFIYFFIYSHFFSFLLFFFNLIYFHFFYLLIFLF